MTTNALAAIARAPKQLRYASILRCIGQSLEEMQLKAVEVKTHGDDIVVQAWQRGTSMTLDFEKHYTQEELHELDTVGRAKRRPYFDPPDLLSLSHVFRLAGNYVDRLRGRLVRISWQDQSDKIQSITVQWELSRTGVDFNQSMPTTVEELCIHIYKQRKKINLATERQSHRPFVSVGRKS
jgi:hypothetical protein